jgi:sulfur-oxidizing protein SoxB
MGQRISDMRLGGQLLDASRKYKVAGWAPVAEEARSQKLPQVWDLAEQWLKARGGKVAPRRLNQPRLIGMAGNPGVA